jgi:endonuclease/exonuclease/phosphatase family metal-dependent hydrolase
MTPGSENASRQTVRKLCDHFAVSEAAREVYMTTQFETHMRSADEVRLLRVQEIPVRIPPETRSSLIEVLVVFF